MAYKFTSAGLGLSISKLPKDVYLDEFQAVLDAEIQNAPNAYTIQEEYPYASGEYRDVNVRITHVINNKTGEKLGDDYKNILFGELNHPLGVGTFYYFDDNYWITIFTSKLKDIVPTVTVRRCNNTLRWRDSDGRSYSTPIVAEYLVKENRDYSTAGTNLVTPSGFLEVTAQFNSASNKIRPNARFLLGNADNWTAYKVLGGGVNNFQNQKTMDNTSVGLMRLSMITNYVNFDTDDLVNGIADVYQYDYKLDVNPSTISGNAKDTIQLNAIVKMNNAVVSRNVVWSSSNTKIATVDGSGLVTLVALGTCTINCHLEQNDLVHGSSSVSVVETAVQDYEIAISPSTNTILQGDTTAFDVRLRLNGSVLPDTFTFGIVDSGIPAENYLFNIINGNQFSIQNVKLYMSSPLQVRCTSGSHEKIIDIILKGTW